MTSPTATRRQSRAGRYLCDKMSIRKLQGQFEATKGIYYEYDDASAPVGEGGMGVVYHGFCIDERTGLRREVAIKALHDDLPEEVYARAEREASIQMRHDNLVEMLGLITTFETNRLGEPVCHHYVISEFLHGVELSDLLAGNLDRSTSGDNGFARELYRRYSDDREATSIYIIKNVLSGVLALHDKGYIHRDIDPSNIMVTDDGCIKLIDFGIAKNLKALGSNDKLTTASGKFIGKAEYASPELVLGDVRNQDYTTDIYALGILFYRLLVGHLPFDGSQYEVLQHQLKQKVPVGNIDNKALAKVVKKATEKIQGNRYGSIAEFRVAIDTAEKYKPGIWDRYKKTLAITSVISLSAICIAMWRSWDGAVTVSGQQVGFEQAMGMLDSDIPDSVMLGFDGMKRLADNGDDEAKIEIGVTYFANDGNKTVSRRRALLGKGNDRLPGELRNTVKYLSGVGDKSIMTPDVYYILGAAYYLLNDEANALKYFEEAKRLLNMGVPPMRGYDSDVLAEVLDNNIGVLSEALKSRE